MDQMNHTTASPESRWSVIQRQDYQEDIKENLETALKIVGYTSAYLLSVFTTIGIIICICLFCRMLRVTLGSRIKPDGKKAILITGATSGIGLVIAKYFFNLGFTVIAGYFNDQEPGYAELLELGIKSSTTNSPSSCSLLLVGDEHTLSQSTIRQRKKSSSNKGSSSKARLFLVRMDVRSRESIEKSSQEIDSILDQHNIELLSLINNAGITRDAAFQWVSREAIRDVVETNLTGVMMVTRQFLYRIVRCGGRVINVASGLYMFPCRGVTVYGASKSAIAYYSDSLQADLEESGASCRCVVPGNFITASNILFPRLRSLQECIAKLTPEEKELYKESIEEYIEVMENLVRKRFSLSDDLDPIQVSTVYKVRLPDDVMSGDKLKMKKRTGSKGGPSMFERVIGWIFQKLDGGANVESLEASGLIQGYDYAVRLKSCPRRLYPGKSFYSHFTGPGMDYMPKVVLDFMAKLIMISLKNQ